MKINRRFIFERPYQKDTLISHQLDLGLSDRVEPIDYTSLLYDRTAIFRLCKCKIIMYSIKPVFVAISKRRSLHFSTMECT